MPPGVVARQHAELRVRRARRSRRDLARVLRNYYSRSQSQSIEDVDLATAESQRSTPTTSRGCFRRPSSSTARRSARSTATRRGSPTRIRGDAQFYARADNLREWLAVVELRLGSLSQRLSASVGQVRVNTDSRRRADRRGDASRPTATSIVKTPWLEIDDVFYEGAARVGAAAVPARRAIRLRAHARGQERRREPAADHPRARGRLGARSGAR